MSDKERKMIFSNNLLRALNDSKKSQIEVAKAIGVSQQTFNTWCRGVALPRMGKIQLLADFFKINMSDLIEEPAAPSSDPIAPVQLRSDESELLDKYNLLNAEGMKEIHNHADYIASQDRFLKDTSEVIREVG